MHSNSVLLKEEIRKLSAVVNNQNNHNILPQNTNGKNKQIPHSTNNKDSKNKKDILPLLSNNNTNNKEHTKQRSITKTPSSKSQISDEIDDDNNDKLEELTKMMKQILDD